MDQNWAPWDAKRRSYEMLARYVMPRLQNLNDNRVASLDWAAANRPEFIGQVQAAVGARIVGHIATKGTDNISPEILAALAEAAKQA